MESLHRMLWTDCVAQGGVRVTRYWYAGCPKSAPAAPLGVDRKTVRKYLASAEASGIIPGGPPMTEADWAGLIEVPACTWTSTRGPRHTSRPSATSTARVGRCPAT